MTFTSLPIKHLCCFVSDDFSTKIGYSQGNRLILRSSDSKGVVDQEILGDEQLIINGFELVTEPVKQIVCYGGNLFQVFPMIEDRKQSSPTVYKCSDWIITSKAIHPASVTFLLSHNVMEVWQLMENSQAELVRTFSFEHMSIIYSGFIAGETLPDLAVFSGTVFNQIQLYLPHSSEKCVQQLDSHTGAVFSIHYCSSKHQLYSTSDDRSLKIWQFQSNSLVSGVLPSRDQWKSGHWTLNWTLYGHEARVWGSSITPFGLITHGEDGLVCLWCPVKGQLLKKIMSGKGSIRSSLALQQDEVLFGTDLGCLFILRVQPESSNSTDVDWLRQILPKAHYFIKVIWIAEDLIVAISNQGEVVVDGNLGKNQENYVKIMADANLSNCSVDKIIFGEDVILLAIGDMCGIVSLISFTKASTFWTYRITSQEKIFSGQIHSVIWAGRNVLLISGPDGIAKLCNCDSSGNLYSFADLSIPTGKRRWFTTALNFSTSTGHNSTEFWFCGDRNGSVALYKTSEKHECLTVSRPICLMMKIHGTHGVTDMRCSSQFEKGSEKYLIHSVGRDGRIRHWQLDLATAKFCLRLDQKFDKNLEWPAKFVSCGKHQLLVGFKSNRFAVYSPTSRSLVWETECGGGHRSWSFISYHDHFRFAYCKDGGIHVHKGNIFISHDLQALVHTRRINGIALVDSDSSLFASVSEDTNVVLWRHSNGKLEVTETLSRHISSVHCVTTAGSFVFTAGGRAELCVWRIHECGNGNSSELIGFDKLGESDARYTGLTAFQESEMSMWVAATGSDGFLRVFYLNTEEKLLKLKFVSKPVDSCLMNVAVVLTGHSVLAVTIATNGNAFLYEFDITQEPTNEVRIDSKIIKVKPIDDKQQNQHISAVEHKEMELTWFGQLQKCSLTALAVRQSKADLLVVAGSEAGRLSLLSFDNFNPPNVKYQETFEALHASTITAVQWIANDQVASLASDQRVILWRLVDQKLDCQSCYFTYVADPASFVCFSPDENNMKMIVVGAGIDSINFPQFHK